MGDHPGGFQEMHRLILNNWKPPEFPLFFLLFSFFYLPLFTPIPPIHNTSLFLPEFHITWKLITNDQVVSSDFALSPTFSAIYCEKHLTYILEEYVVNID